MVSALESFGLDDIAPGPVYRTLRELEVSGLAQSKWDTESSSGPARRVYRLTEAGDRYLVSWIEDLRKTEHMLKQFLEMYDQHIHL